mmetsp:Transcript_74616/g.211065  ORF Transcript_74616/g.211065 Transcript_74616/m.211065 type:complete len:138 (-) Transcript_74616:337-750(-)
MPRGPKNKKVKARGVKKAQLKQEKKAVQKNGDITMGGTTPGAKRAASESAHDLFKRHARESKAVKAEVATLKRQRKILPKKGNKEAKKQMSQKIRSMVEELKQKHQAELEAAGVDRASRQGEVSEDEDEDGDDDEDI